MFYISPNPKFDNLSHEQLIEKVLDFWRLSDFYQDEEFIDKQKLPLHFLKDDYLLFLVNYFDILLEL